MKSNSRRYRRHRNPENAEKKDTPFFSPAEKAVQKKEDSAFFQPKLSVGQPGDTYEREADAVASKVVNREGRTGTPVQKKEISAVQRMPDEEVQAKSAPEKKEEEKKVQKKEEEDVQMKSAPDKKEEEKKVQKKAAPEKKEEEKPIQKKEEPEKKPAADEVLKEEKEKPAVMAKAGSAGLQQDTDGLSQQLKEQSGKGAKLSPEVRNEMSNAIGADFGGVNIHTGPKATELSNELGAQAFTHGNDVYFNSGKYDADSSAGKHLLAHELTHVVQQGAAPTFSGSQSKAASTPGVQRESSTPLPEGVKPDKKSKIASFPIGDFTVVVKPDRKARKGEKVDAEGATTKGEIAYGLHPKWKDGKVESVAISKKLVIETIYAKNVSAKDSSEYGRGALTKDKKEGHSTLGFHEGSHGTDCINYVSSHAFPEIVIESPVTEAEYKVLVDEWKVKFDAYQDAMIADSMEKTDNVKDPVEE